MTQDVNDEDNHSGLVNQPRGPRPSNRHRLRPCSGYLASHLEMPTLLENAVLTPVTPFPYSMIEVAFMGAAPALDEAWASAVSVAWA
jgi:hypothetical protein